MSSKPPVNRLRLGRGIGALLSGGHNAADEVREAQTIAPPPSSTADTVADIRRLPIDAIAANPFQPRRQFNEASLQELATSLQANGLIQPIVVTAVGQGYQLIAGERRLRAARLAGLTEVPVVVRQVDPALQARLALVENIHREDLNPIDRAQGYQFLLADSALTQQDLATLLGEQRSTIANHLRLLDLPPAIRGHIQAGTLSLGHAKVLAGIPLAELQLKLAEQAVTEQWSVRQLEERLVAVSEASDDKPIKPPHPKALHYKDLSLQLARALGVRVQVQPAGKKGAGKVVLHYGTLDEFDALLAQLGVKLDEA